MSVVLERKCFTTKRTLEFFTESELTTQIGYGRRLWPVVLAKELIDNSLDACESANVAPEIVVTLEPDALLVRDNGPGLPGKVVERSLDYSIRVSDKKYYVSPTRGQLGNALKCVWVVPFVVSGNEFGAIEVTACGVHHRIEVRLDRIAQEPVVTRTTSPLVQNGTSVKVRWAGIAGLMTHLPTLDLYNEPIRNVLPALMADFAAFNPHASFRLNMPDRNVSFAASQTTWTKWLPNQPTSAHWYTPERLRDLIAAYIVDEQNSHARTIREFVSEFDGLRRSQYQKRVTEEAGLSGPLADLAKTRDIPLAGVANLLDAMKKHSRPVKPTRLGVIGEEHLRSVLKRHGVGEGSFKYKRCSGSDNGLPFVVEVAFGVKKEKRRRLILGLNHSPIFKIPSGHVGDALNDCRVQDDDPVVLLVHQSCPQFAFTDHGKGALE